MQTGSIPIPARPVPFQQNQNLRRQGDNTNNPQGGGIINRLISNINSIPNTGITIGNVGMTIGIGGLMVSSMLDRSSNIHTLIELTSMTMIGLSAAYYITNSEMNMTNGHQATNHDMRHRE